MTVVYVVDVNPRCENRRNFSMKLRDIKKEKNKLLGINQCAEIKNKPNQYNKIEIMNRNVNRVRVQIT